MVWRLTTEEFDPKCPVPTVKHNGRSLMVWSCFSRNGVEYLCFFENIMNRVCYREILQKNLLQSSKKLCLENALVFQHNDDHKHTVRTIKDWLKH